MNLTDREILEINELCNGLVDGTLTEKQRARLFDWLTVSEAARRHYVRTMAFSASLYQYASEMQVEAPDALPEEPANVIRPFPWRWLSPLAAAAGVVLAFWLFHSHRPETRVAEMRADENVARLTGSRQCQWSDNVTALKPGDGLRKGQRLELLSGFAELTFDSGAQVVLEGPASLDLNSAWDATLLRGSLKANVPPEAMGFRISNLAVEVVDLGTEFTMIADGSGAADVLVLRGMIEASPRDSNEERTIVLHENQSRHFAPSGISNVSNPGQKFARFTQPVPLDHFAPATRYIHWSFDEPEGDLLRADSFGAPLDSFSARVDQVSDTVLGTIHTEGRWGRALRFNGHLYARAAFPGLSGNSPHTALFWVKVPVDVHLPNAYAMLAWNATNEKLGVHPVHIGWNRNPTEGTVGVLRTDYAGGFALGATPLRDGRWHHIAVVFVPGADPETPVEVKQYVDGRFEGEGKPSPPGTEVSTRFSEEDPNTRDALFLGCRVGVTGPRKERFRGEIDEVCLADRALEPRDIVQLMKENQPLPAELAAVKK